MNMRKKTFPLVILALMGLAVVVFLYQKNIFSKDVLRLEVFGPESIELGQEANYLIKYKNNGKITLEEARITFEAPANSLIEGGNLRIEKDLGDIYPGEEKTLNFSARIFGKEGETKKVQAWLNYKPKNLKARYESYTTQTTTIKFSPLNFEFDLASKIESGEEFDFSLNYFSNVDYPLSHLRIKIEYPPGFEFISSSPRAMDKTEWDLPILNKAQGGRVKITGRLSGNINEQKIFKASLGLWQNDEFILLKEATKGTEIIRPSIYISQLVNGSLDYAANPGDILHYEIFFKNIGSTPFENLFLVARLEGDLFDFKSIKTEKGDFKTGDNSLVWDWKKSPQLKFLGENEEGKVEFWIDLKEKLPSGSKNQALKDKISIFPAEAEFAIRVNSQMFLQQKAYFDDEVFGNSGTIPPQVGQTTTYTVIWEAKNSYNDLKNVKVRAVLPSNVSLTGQLFPKEAKFVFDSQSREIIWEIGDLMAQTTPPPNFSFQIAFIPDELQKGQTPEIIGKATSSAEDAWTQEAITAEVEALNTGSLSDNGFKQEQGIVQ